MATTPKCQAKNPMLCHDPRCPEKRYNLKFSMEAMTAAKEAIKDLKENKEYHGFAKEEADLNYRASVDWYNELLAESRITGEQGTKWLNDIDARYAVLSDEKKALEEQIDTMHPENNVELLEKIEEVEVRIKELREEYPEAYRAFYATFDGQKQLFHKLAKARKQSPKPKVEMEKTYDQIFDGQNLHKQQIIAMIIVDRKNANADLPIEIRNIVDTKVLSKEELKEYKEWTKANPEFLANSYVSIKQAVDRQGNILWVIKESVEDKGSIIPEAVAKTLYTMPVTTYRGDFIKLSYMKAEQAKNQPTHLEKKVDPAYQQYLAEKYDYDVLVKFEHKLKNR